MSASLDVPVGWPALLPEFGRTWARRHRRLARILAAGAVIGVSAQLLNDEPLGVMLILLVPLVACFGAGAVVMSGIVSDERRSGLLVMWAQQPGSIVKPYAIRYALHLLLLSAFAVVLAAVVIAAAVATGTMTLQAALPIALTALSAATLTAAVVFAMSAWGFRHDGAAALLWALGSLTVAASFAFQESLLARTVTLLAYPADSILGFMNPASLAGGRAQATLVVTCHLLAWSLIGLAGLVHTERTVRRGLGRG
jgi:hypothetical protein